MASDEHYTEARAHMAGRDEQLTELWARVDGETFYVVDDETGEDLAGPFYAEDDAEDAATPTSSVEQRDDEQDAARQELDELPLALEVRVELRLVLSTGGPHEELAWTFGEPNRARFVYLPWFDRVELSDVPDSLLRLAEEHDEYVRDVGLAAYLEQHGY